jgi:hypothetical protein
MAHDLKVSEAREPLAEIKTDDLLTKLKRLWVWRHVVIHSLNLITDILYFFTQNFDSVLLKCGSGYSILCPIAMTFYTLKRNKKLDDSGMFEDVTFFTYYTDYEAIKDFENNLVSSNKRRRVGKSSMSFIVADSISFPI